VSKDCWTHKNCIQESEACYLPFPATDENKVVNQLEDITKDSEKKASEIFDILESVSNDLQDKRDSFEKIIEIFKKDIKILSTLSKKFPNMKIFRTTLQRNIFALESMEKVLDLLQTSEDSIVSIMDIMQYQDIHRQKIERVINVMRSLSTYMNSLLDGRVDDEKRVLNTRYIPEDKPNKEVVSASDIELLLSEFGRISII
jgi:hypothetical protein